jgi:hypothetical protein
VKVLALDRLFAGRHFDHEINILCVRWHLRFRLSFRDFVEMMDERGLLMATTTIIRRVRHDVPKFERHWQRFANPAQSLGLSLCAAFAGKNSTSAAWVARIQPLSFCKTPCGQYKKLHGTVRQI